MNKIVYLVLIIFLFSSLAYCISSPGMVSGNPETRNVVVEKAMNMIGTPYRYGGKDPVGFDCSGLVYHVMGEIGIIMNASAQTQSSQGKAIKLEDALPGDLLFFKRPNEKNIFHVSILQKVNKDQIWLVHSTSSKGVVSQELNSSSYWSSKLFKVTRVINR